MKKPNFSKAAIQKFFLYHAEKLVLLLSVVLLVLFFWMGLKSPVFSEKTPDELVRLAEKADGKMRDVGNWDSIKDFRNGKHDVVDVIKKAAGNLTPDKFKIDPFTGAVAKKADRRKDPNLFPVIEPHAITFKAPVIIMPRRKVKTDPLQDFSRPPNSDSENASSRGFNTEFDFEELGDEDFGGQDGRGGGREARGGGRGASRKKSEPEEVDLPVLEGIGTEMQTVHVHEAAGVRPPMYQISTDSSESRLFDVVCVTGLVDFKQQWTSFDRSFASSIGYYPDRDKPIYQYLQVERREVDDRGNPLKGKLGKWSDQSEMILHKVPNAFPTMHQMPNAMYSSAPDIVAPENFDPVLTGPIPAIAMFNYLPLINHPKLADNLREFSDLDEDEAEVPLRPGEIFGELGRNEPRFGSGSDREGRRGSRPRSTFDEDEVAPRSGSNFDDYWKALEAETPTDDYRLVRFFDVLAKPGRTYEYRMRVWVGDPNNEDPQENFAKLGDGGDGRNGLAGRNRGVDSIDPEEMEEDFDPRNVSRTGRDSQIEKTKFVKTPIVSQMQDPQVRIRLNRARADKDAKSGDLVYFVSEKHGEEDAEGKDIYEEVAVPKERPYLRFARPSKWSQPVRVKVTNRNSQVAVGGVEPPKMARLKNGQAVRTFPIAEPVVEVVASAWSKGLGTAMPTKQQVYRGDALNFRAPAYILHPITWDVLVAQNDSDQAGGDDKYLIEINTGNVVVDAMGGEELPLPRSEKIRHAVPGEVLLMDEFGEFHVQNDLDDKTVYRNFLFLPDESQTVGRARAPKKPKDDEESRDRYGEGFDRDF